MSRMEDLEKLAFHLGQEQGGGPVGITRKKSLSVKATAWKVAYITVETEGLQGQWKGKKARKKRRTKF